MERQIALTLSHRDHLSHGKNREMLGYEAYHWGVMVMPKNSQGNDCETYEATDATEIDPVTWRMVNPTMDWWLRAKATVDPALSDKLIGRIIVGVVPREVSHAALKKLFEGIPLPVKNTHPQQSCVSWAVDAILALQKKGWAWAFDMNQFQDWSLSYADERLKGQGPREAVVSYLDVQE